MAKIEVSPSGKPPRHSRTPAERIVIITLPLLVPSYSDWETPLSSQGPGFDELHFSDNLQLLAMVAELEEHCVPLDGVEDSECDTKV